MAKRDLKIIAATLTIIGAILSILDRIFTPDYLVFENSPSYPNFLRFLGLIFLIIPPIIYIGLDWRNLFPKKKDTNKG